MTIGRATGGTATAAGFVVFLLLFLLLLLRAAIVFDPFSSNAPARISSAFWDVALGYSAVNNPAAASPNCSAYSFATSS